MPMGALCSPGKGTKLAGVSYVPYRMKALWARPQLSRLLSLQLAVALLLLGGSKGQGGLPDLLLQGDVA